MKFFICGTDTGVGKTFVSTALGLKYNLTYFKPIQSGYQERSAAAKILKFEDLDSVTDREFTENFGVRSSDKELYLLKKPLSPNQSAHLENLELDIDFIENSILNSEHQIIEGCGGLMVPLTSKYLLIDLLAQLKIPVLLVARSGLGTLNHTLLSVEALRIRMIPLLGVILNGPKHVLNEESLCQFNVPLLGRLEPLTQLTKSDFISSLHLERSLYECMDN